MTPAAARIGKILSLVGLCLYLFLVVVKFHPQRLIFQEKSQDLPVTVEEVIQFIEGFSYKETREGETVFSVMAEKVLGFAENTHRLENVTLKFHTEDGVLFVTCREVDFDEKNKDFGIRGNIHLTTEWGLTMWTEEMAYRHRSRFLMGFEKVHFTYGDEFWGVLNRPVLDVRRNILSVSEGATIHDVMGNLFETMNVEVVLRTGKFTFPSGALVRYQDVLGEFRRIEVRQTEVKLSVKGYCGHLLVKGAGSRYEVVAPYTHAVFDKKASFRPMALTLPEGGTWTGPDGQGRAGSARMLFKKGTIQSLFLNDHFKLKDPVRQLTAINGNGHFDSEGIFKNFDAFGNIVFCSDNTYVRSEYLTAQISEDTYTFRVGCLLRSGPLEARGKSITYRRENEQVILHEEVHVMDVIQDSHIQSDHALVHVDSNAASFSGSVHAWTKDYDLQCDRVYTKNDCFQAEGSARLVNYAGGQEVLSGDRMELDEKHGILKARGNVKVKSENYDVTADSLAGNRQNGEWNVISFHGNVVFVDQEQELTGEAEHMTLLRNGGEVVFLEGCPARVKDREEQVIASPVMVLDRTWQQMFLIGQKTGTRLEVKGERPTRTSD